MHKIIINIGVAAYEQSNVVGERFSADDSKKSSGILSGTLFGVQKAFWGPKTNPENRNYQPSFKSFLLYDVSYLATSLVCLFSLELMAFQVKHIKRKKGKTSEYPHIDPPTF